MSWSFRSRPPTGPGPKIGRVKKTAAALVLCLVIAGCSSGSPDRAARTPRPAPAANPACQILTADELESITEGVQDGYKLTQGAALPLPDDQKAGNFTRLAVVEIEGPGLKQGDVAILAVSDAPLSNILAVDGMAKQFTTWGEAAQEGSPVDGWRKSVNTSKTTTTAKACPRS